MESEGQAQTQGQPVESPSADQMQGAPGPAATPDPDEATPRGGDQDIDTAGTGAGDDSERAAANDPTGSAKNASVEVPGDTGSGDIVGRTGEQMPLQSHDGVESESRQTAANRSLNH